MVSRQKLASSCSRASHKPWSPPPTRYNEFIVPLTCYLDAFSGISGDMLVGALADAGADQDAIAQAIRSLDAGAAVSFEKVQRGGIAATKYRVAVEDGHGHRHLSDILEMIARSAISGRARYNAQAIFRKLGEAEADVHQVPVEQVHFHEVGAADSIADIVGACVALDLLGVNVVVCSPINVGSGTVGTEHGTLPVPAPATARLLTGIPVYAQGPPVELATPTGAAVAATLSSRFGTLPPMKISRIGYGAGDRDFSEQANVLRVLLGEPTGADEAVAVSVLEANIDDSNPQVLAYAAERLLDAGALDVTVQPAVMKKGRLGHLLRVIAKPQDRETLAQLIFAETSTLGLRIYQAERRVEARSFTDVETPYGAVRMKVSGEGSFAPEYEDCRKLALEAGVSLKQVLAAANHAYLAQTK
jgi:pyridinium-3,5-bisthiocarboxylic acid mononucleotide nickel chelatase